MQEFLNRMENAGYITANDLRWFSILESRTHHGKSKIRHQIECLEKVGYGVAPDPRYVFWAENYSSPKYFFPVEKESLSHWREQGLRSEILEMALAAIVLNDGGKISSFERESFLNVGESIYGDESSVGKRYNCHMRWVLNDPPGIETIPAIVQNFRPIEFEGYGGLFDFVSFTVSNGFVHRSKLRVIERVLKENNKNLKYYYGLLEQWGEESTVNNTPRNQKYLKKKKINFVSKNRSNLNRGVQKIDSTTVSDDDQGYYGRAAVDKLVGVSKKDKSRALQWIPKDSMVTIAGRKIKGMIYIGKSTDLFEFDQFYCRACIDPTLKISKQEVKKNTDGLPEYPSYLRLDSRYRATYLNWLATDRVDKQYSTGFPKLYLYGLEYRFFVDNPSLKEKREILAEARRVFEAYEPDDPTYLLLHKFIDIAAVLIGDEELQPIIELGKRSDWKSLTPVMIGIGQQIAMGQNLSADWGLSWYLNQHDTRLSYSIRKYSSEFRLHFRCLFDKEFPKGYKLRPIKDSYKILMYSSSNEFAQELEFTMNGKPLPNVHMLEEPLEKIKTIFDQTVKDLRPLERHLTYKTSKRYSIEVLEKVPEGIRGETWACRLSFLETIAKSGLGESYSLRDLCEKIEEIKREKLSLRQYTEVSRLLNSVGYGLSPDPRLLARSPKLDDLVLVFPVGANNKKGIEISEGLLTWIVEVGVGVWIGSPNQGDESNVESIMNQRIESISNITVDDSKVLQANVKWFISTQCNIASFSKWLKATTPEQKEDLRKSALSMARINGDTSPDSISRLEKLYALLGYDGQKVYSDVYAGEATDGPVTVRRARIGPKGETIPADTKDNRAVSLDPEKIDELVDETAKVRAILSNVFLEYLSSEKQKSDEVSSILSVFSGLDKKHTGFVTEFLTKERWTGKGYEKLATKHDLMSQGSLEVINEWSFDRFDDNLIEEFDGYLLNPKTAEKLKELLQPTEE